MRARRRRAHRLTGGVAGVIAVLAAASALAGPGSAAPLIQTIGSGFGFASSNPPGRTVLRIAINPRGAGLSTRSVTVVECYHGSCAFATPATTGFVQAVFNVPARVGARVSVLVVACSRLGCVRAVRAIRILQFR